MAFCILWLTTFIADLFPLLLAHLPADVNISRSCSRHDDTLVPQSAALAEDLEERRSDVKGSTTAITGWFVVTQDSVNNVLIITSRIGYHEND